MTKMTLAELSAHDRIVIAGAPCCGKTTLAARIESTGRTVFHTDDYIEHGWEDAPTVACQDLAAEDRWIVEGVQCGRMLRKGLVADVVVWLDVPMTSRTDGQERMAKGCATIFEDWRSTASESVLIIHREDLAVSDGGQHD